jgi:cobalt-zinc-cadmium efflux system protein
MSKPHNSEQHDNEHGSAHSHHGHHHHGLGAASRQNAEGRKQLSRVLAITILFMCVEAVGGYYTNSLALMSDAVHMLADTGALALSLFAFYMSAKPTSDARTYGFYRFEILAAFINGVFLVILSLAIIWGAWLRYNDPVQIKSLEMFGISFLGFFFNLVSAWLLIKGDHKNLNIKGALFHILGDALGAFGAMVAALLIYNFGWHQADPVVSVIIAIIIIASSFRLILDTTHVILEGAPHHLDTDQIRRSIQGIPQVLEVHDLHVWSIASGMISLSVHVVADAAAGNHKLLCVIREMLKEKYEIDHVTIQIESQSLRTSEPHY